MVIPQEKSFVNSINTFPGCVQGSLTILQDADVFSQSLEQPIYRFLFWLFIHSHDMNVMICNVFFLLFLAGSLHGNRHRTEIK